MCRRTAVVYGVPVSSAQSPQPKKKRRLAQYLQNIKDSYTVSRRSYPWIGWAMLAVLATCLALGAAIALGYGLHLWYWLVLGLMLAFVINMGLLTFLVRRASYSQLEGRPGAAKVVLDQFSRGWYVESEPVAFTKDQDLVWRLVGRPGVVLIAEGPSTRTRRMLAEAVAVYLDGGRAPGGKASTIIDFTGDEHGRVLRQGAIDLEELREVVPELQAG